MSYNLSRASVERMRHYLDVLLEPGTHIFAAENPSSLAYRLREAIMAAAGVEVFAKYAGLRGKHRIRVRPGQVICEAIGPERALVDGAYPIASMHVEDAKTFVAVLGAATKFSHVMELIFPHVNLKFDEKQKLLAWTQDKSWQYIDHEGAGITLTKHEVDADLLWGEDDG
jgi:hypothetical protein